MLKRLQRQVGKRAYGLGSHEHNENYRRIQRFASGKVPARFKAWAFAGALSAFDSLDAYIT